MNTHSGLNEVGSLRSLATVGRRGALIAAALSALAMSAPAFAAGYNVEHASTESSVTPSGSNSVSSPTRVQTPMCSSCIMNRLSSALHAPWWVFDGWEEGLNGIYAYGVLLYPNYDSVVTKIVVPVNYRSGTNAANVSLYADAGGVPGNAIATKQFTNLPPLGSCCTPIVWKTKIPVTQGVPVWLVVSVTGDTDVVWNYDVTDEVDPLAAAYNDGSGWTTMSALPAMAGRVQLK